VTEVLSGLRPSIGLWLNNVVGAVYGVLMFFFVLVLLRVLVRNRWVAAALFVVLFTFPKILGSHNVPVDTVVWVIIYAIAAFAVVRFGLIALAMATFTANVLLNVPYTLNFSLWYAPIALCVVASFLVLAVWAFYVCLAGQRIFEKDLFE